jgi:hypothetical protein
MFLIVTHKCAVVLTKVGIFKIATSPRSSVGLNCLAITTGDGGPAPHDGSALLKAEHSNHSRLSHYFQINKHPSLSITNYDS